MRKSALILAVLVAWAPDAGAARRHRRVRRGAPAAKARAVSAPPAEADAAPAESAAAPAEAGAPPVEAAPAPAPRKKAPRLSAEPSAEPGEAAPAATGTAAHPEKGGLRIDAVPAGDALSDLGLKTGDLLMTLDSAAVKTGADLARTLASRRPGDRTWAVVMRGEQVIGLETPFSSPAPAAARSAEALSPREEAAREGHLEAAKAQAAAPLRLLSAPELAVPSGERLWLRFPAGLPSALGPGDVVQGETAAPLASDRKLDFLAVPPGSRVWLQALASDEDGPIRTVRLHAYKIALLGGRTYPLSAIPSAAAGSGAFARVSAGGTLVTTAGDAQKNILGPDWTLQFRLLEPLTLREPEGYYRSGPGLWMKEVYESGVRALEVTHVIPGRSAERAGLKPGDRVYSVDGDAAARLGFASALDKLYGPVGSEVALRVTRRSGARQETLKLARGAAWRQGYGLRLRRDGENIMVQDSAAGSPAAAAGIRSGMLLLRVGDREAPGLDRAALKALLEGEGDDAVDFVLSAGSKEKTYTLARGWYPVPLKLDAKPAPYAP